MQEYNSKTKAQMVYVFRHKKKTCGLKAHKTTEPLPSISVWKSKKFHIDNTNINDVSRERNIPAGYSLLYIPTFSSPHPIVITYSHRCQ